jgi:long-chain acyl-CoA synthetase
MTIEECIYKNSLKFPQKPALICGNQTVTYSVFWQMISSYASDLNKLSECRKMIYQVYRTAQNIDFAVRYFAAHLAKIINVPVDNDISKERFEEIENELSASASSMCGEHSVADIMFTTGTTGRPKGVMLTHENLSAAVENINAFVSNTADDTELIALPLGHSFGLGRLRCVLSKGGTAVLANGFANIKKLFETIENQHCTGFAFVPAAWNYIQRISGDKISKFAGQLKYIEIGSSYMSETSKRKLMSLLPQTRICMHYGLTEASRSTFLSFFDDEKHLNSIGRESQNTEIKIFEDGEIGVKGPHVFHGYLNGEKAEFRDGFFLTGDCGKKDSDGYIYLTGRKKEIINVGGKKVSPFEVESVLNTYPDIKESCCVGVHDEVYGEVVKAYLVVNKTVDYKELRKFLNGKIETYKFPASFETVTNLPKTESGKLQRLKLK